MVMPGWKSALLGVGQGIRNGSYMGGLMGLAGRAALSPFMQSKASIHMGAGMLAGGLYGAFSDNTSVLGGMAMGGLAGLGIGRYGGAGLAMGRTSRLAGGSLSQVARAAGRGSWITARADAYASKQFIGRNITKGYNRIRGLF